MVDVREAENDGSCWFSYLLGFCQQVFFTSVNLVALCSEPAVAWIFVLRHNPHCPSALSVGSWFFGRPVSREASSKGDGRGRGMSAFSSQSWEDTARRQLPANEDEGCHQDLDPLTPWSQTSTFQKGEASTC